ncbi:MAG TPA: SDR family oxidoreductase [Thermoanaerobaculia bacterium]|jgi:dTDP-4-dehydrorhamnose reductase|nr:SDR family oxidoreductase [Thermoanaerobaculia bacterium]
MTLPTRVLILGAGGMLGHKVWEVFRDRFECRAALRTPLPLALFDDARVISGFDATNFDDVARLIEVVKPDVVVNCIGVVKQLAAAHDPIASITLNALFPHVVARACAEAGARMIHISTDCVFAGTRGHYTEEDVPDAADLYGRSKLLGEVTEGALTIRTSIIGRELRTSNGLVEWFLSNRGGSVRGFTNAIFSGVTTAMLARILAAVIEHHPGMHGLYHVAGAPISKYDLLMMLNAATSAGVTIAPDPGSAGVPPAVQHDAARYGGRDARDPRVIDRSLDATRFQAATGLQPPEWPEMIAALAAESPHYERWRTE